MNENNPFFIRMRLIEIAKDILMEKYQSDRQNYDMFFHTRFETDKTLEYMFEENPPTIEEVMVSAEKLNGFVSHGTATPKTKGNR